MARQDIAPPRDHTGRWARYAVWRRGGNRWRAVLTVLLGIGLGAYAWVAATARPLTGGSLIGVLIPGVVIGAIAYGRPPERIPAPERLDVRGISYWLICLALLFEWEASAFRDNSLWWHPSLTDLINPLIGPHLTKSAAMLVWMLAGWGLVKR